MKMAKGGKEENRVKRNKCKKKKRRAAYNGAGLDNEMGGL